MRLRRKIMAGIRQIGATKRRTSNQDRWLLKAMEDIQLADARQKPEVRKMLPRKKLNLENYDDVLLLAKRLDITYGDVHAIYNAQGDWANLAQRLSISPTVVDSVKVAFGD